MQFDAGTRASEVRLVGNGSTVLRAANGPSLLSMLPGAPLVSLQGLKLEGHITVAAGQLLMDGCELDGAAITALDAIDPHPVSEAAPLLLPSATSQQVQTQQQQVLDKHEATASPRIAPEPAGLTPELSHRRNNHQDEAPDTDTVASMAALLGVVESVARQPKPDGGGGCAWFANLSPQVRHL